MKTVLITGISRGIGRALAEKFLAEGYFVIGTFFSSEVDIENKNLTVFPLDLSKSQSIADCAKNIDDLGKRIDVVINNAGVLFDEEETGVIVEKLRRTLEVNLFGTIDFTERIISLIQKDGHIINISSTAGSLELAGIEKELSSHYPHHYPAYKISKTALNMYTRTLASRLHEAGVIVSSVHPGWVKTEMGGEEAELTPKEAAEGIYKVAISKPETGQFWFQDKHIPW
ncbi:MAG: SDR family NAD(P)-dependent oxidoreductase [Parcubacteria group bacterium]|nr:SDR family NAD(P)-dependent oxidoreductase [Parcubacteria group bacterium]